MKIARIVLTATILFSLKSTLFCSAPQASQEAISSSVKKPGYDASRKGWLASSNTWMLENMGSSYKHYTTECQVRPESDDEDESKSNGSRARWARIGQEDVQTVKQAENFIKYTAKLNLPEKSMRPSYQLIQQSRTTLFKTDLIAKAENRTPDAIREFDENLTRKNYADILYMVFCQINKDSKLALRNREQETTLRPYQQKKLQDQQAAQIVALQQQHVQELFELQNSNKQNDIKLTATLTSNRQSLDVLQSKAASLNHLIAQKPFIVKKSTKITPEIIACLAAPYKNFGSKTYAQALSSSTSEDK